LIRVNLLPHRELRRRRQQRQFFVMLGVVLALGAGIWFMVHSSLEARFEDQVSRNTYLQTEITKLDKEIEEIRKLREMTAALLSRKKVVETLQSNRSEVVQLLDQLARHLPDGTYLRAIKQQGRRVTINGYTQSQARISTLMRNLEASPYLTNASLVEIKLSQQPNLRINEFTMNVSIAALTESAEKAKEKAKTAQSAAAR
jgi:type IV pilus assembly protein PilN